MQLRDEQSLDAAKLYFAKGLSQAEVAAELGVSRPTVAKLLAHAKAKGYVVIEIRDPREQGSVLAEQLVDLYGRFGLQEARIAQTPPDGVVVNELGRVGASLLEEQVRDGQMVGVSWGNTMYAVAKALDHTPRVGVEIVQLKGGLSYTERSTNDIETINLFCRAFDAYARTLPLPVIFDNVEVKKTVESDRHIAQILDHGRNTDVVIFTVGAADRESLPLALGYLDEEETELISELAVGDACSRFFTADGAIAVPSVNDRTVGIEIDDLRQRPVRILVAGGLRKAKAIHTALTMGLATHLVVDHPTALKLIDLQEAH